MPLGSRSTGLATCTTRLLSTANGIGFLDQCSVQIIPAFFKPIHVTLTDDFLPTVQDVFSLRPVGNEYPVLNGLFSFRVFIDPQIQHFCHALARWLDLIGGEGKVLQHRAGTLAE